MIAERYKQKAEMAVNLVDGIKRTGLTITGMRDRYVRMPTTRSFPWSTVSGKSVAYSKTKRTL